MRELTDAERTFFTESATQKGISILFSDGVEKLVKFGRGKGFANRCQAVIAGGFPRDCLLRDGDWSDVDIFILPEYPVDGRRRTFTLLADLLANHTNIILSLARVQVGTGHPFYVFYAALAYEAAPPNFTYIYTLVECGEDAAVANGSDGIFLSFRGHPAGDIPNLNIVFREEPSVVELIHNFPLSLSRVWMDLFPTTFTVHTTRDFDEAVSTKRIEGRLPAGAVPTDLNKLRRYSEKIVNKFPEYTIVLPNSIDSCPF